MVETWKGSKERSRKRSSTFQEYGCGTVQGKAKFIHTTGRTFSVTVYSGESRALTIADKGVGI